jgi:predicted protein tyrosine phosphatase
MSNIASHREYMLSKNPYQGKYRKALFVCSGGILRSPTAAHWAAEHKGWNTRSCGTLPLAVPQVNPTLVDWADVIYCLTTTHYLFMVDTWGEQVRSKLRVMEINDDYEYRDPELIRLIEEALSDE